MKNQLAYEMKTEKLVWKCKKKIKNSELFSSIAIKDETRDEKILLNLPPCRQADPGPCGIYDLPDPAADRAFVRFPEQMDRPDS